MSQDWWHGEKAQRILSVVPQVAQTIDKPDTKPKLFSAPPPILLQQNVPPQSMPNSTQVKTPTVSLIELPAATSSDDNTTIALSVAHPVRPVSAAFTEDLGGVPLTESAANEACMVDANVLAGIREMLASLGIELTAAGEVLIADRVESGASPGDALVQVVLYAFGHAARHGMLETRTFLGLSLSDFAVFAVQELEKLRAADVICEARFDEDMRNLWSTITNPSESLGELLADPIGGAAPPALLPEDMRSSDD